MVMTTEMSIGMGSQLLGQLVLICLLQHMAEETNMSGSKLEEEKKSYSTFYLGSENLQGNCLA
jgi:hypothetical protein